jgi:hypothetical protein
VSNGGGEAKFHMWNVFLRRNRPEPWTFSPTYKKKPDDFSYFQQRVSPDLLEFYRLSMISPPAPAERSEFPHGITIATICMQIIF